MFKVVTIAHRLELYRRRRLLREEMDEYSDSLRLRLDIRHVFSVVSMLRELSFGRGS